MSTGARPNLDERQSRRRARRRRAWVGIGVIFALVVALGVVIVVNAGRWGVPMFAFTNEHGSSCRNDWLGHTCTNVTIEEIESHLGVDVPQGVTALSSTYKRTHDYSLTARLAYPHEVARPSWEKLTEKFGECRAGLPSALSEATEITDQCVMTNEGVGAIGGPPSPEIWRIATGNRSDGAMIVDISLRSR